MPNTGCRRIAAIVVGLACGYAVTIGQPAVAAKPRPSAQEASKARKQVRDRAEELDETAVRLAESRARQEELTWAASQAVEAFHEADVLAAEAKAEHERAAEAVKRADELLRAAREEAVDIAASSYGGYDATRPAMAAVAGEGGPTGYLQRTSVLSHLKAERAEKLRRLRDMRRVQAIIRDQARATHLERLRAVQRAEEAKRAAEEAVARQVEQVRRIEQEQAELQQRLDRARDRVVRIERRRTLLSTLLNARTVRRIGFKYANAKWARAARAEGAQAARGDIVASWALTQLGKPYVWAASGPHAYDCSGLTMRAYERVGIRLDHWTGTQWTSGPHVPIEELSRGDLVFFGKIKNNPKSIHHVGIYIGAGLMVHAPYTGDVVRVAPIWRRDLFGATRPIG
ncbi:NlpC/P60 family protein [Thermopolyspora sp. NPDC052614]|uniref:C40 family peptidase n=1 Tax=Thermopolyspora sp. NPDC052614 TaxID=3155682 RepID=UPI00341412C0